MTSNDKAAARISRIHGEEKKLLSHLYKIYANDYKKYKQLIRQDADVPVSIKKIYTVLDERKAYRRISDYFHRARTAKREKQASPKRLHRHTSRSSTSDHVHTSEASDTTDDQRSTTRSSVAVEINLTRVKKRKLSPWHLHRSPLDTCYDSQPNVPSVPLLSLRTSIQKALDELDRTITSKSHAPSTIERFCQPFRPRNQWFFNGHRYSKLDDIVRSLSAGVQHSSQETSPLMLDESSGSSARDRTARQSDQSHAWEPTEDILQRLQTLVERGHAISDRLERILAQV